MKTHAGRWLLLLLSLSLCLAAAEGIVRCKFRVKWDATTMQERAAQGSIRPLIQSVAGSGLLYELRPGMITEWRGVMVATRADESRRVTTLQTESPTGGLKIAVIGDSTPFGWGVPYEATYPEVFGAHLAGALRAPVEVRNFCVPGYNIHQNLAAFRRYVASWRPDLLVLHYDHNDVEASDAVVVESMAPEYGDNALHSAAIKLLRRELLRLQSQGGGVFGGRTRDDVMSLEGGYSCVYGGERYLRHLAALAALGHEADRMGIPVVAVMWECHLQAVEDPRRQPYYKNVVAPLVSYMQKAGFHVLSLFDAYQGVMRANSWRSLQPLWMTPADLHPTVQGHDAIGRWLFEFVCREPGMLIGLEAVARQRAPMVTSAPLAAMAAQFRRGLLLADRGELDEAVVCIRGVLQSELNNVSVRMNLGRCLREAGRLDEAITEFEHVLELRPESVLARIELGAIRLQQGRICESRAHLQAADAQDPDAWAQQALEHWLMEVEKAEAGQGCGS